MNWSRCCRRQKPAYQLAEEDRRARGDYLGDGLTT